jgi:hypothetical protein
MAGKESHDLPAPELGDAGDKEKGEDHTHAECQKYLNGLNCAGSSGRKGKEDQYDCGIAGQEDNAEQEPQKEGLTKRSAGPGYRDPACGREDINVQQEQERRSTGGDMQPG